MVFQRAFSMRRRRACRRGTRGGGNALLASCHAALHLIGDAEGVLRAVVKRKAKCPALNLIMAEISLTLSQTPWELEAAHIWSEENAIADALSRICQGAALPEEVAEAEFDPVRKQPLTFVGTQTAL